MPEVLDSSPGVAAATTLCEADQWTVPNLTFPNKELEKYGLAISKVISRFRIIIPVLQKGSDYPSSASEIPRFGWL